MFEILGIIFLILLFFGWFPYVMQTNKHGAPFVPMEPEVIEHVMNLLKLKKEEVFYELGSGDGRVVIAAALRGATAKGVEIDFLRVWYSRIWIYLLRLQKHTNIIKKNFFEVDLKDADALYVYLLPETNQKLEKKLEKELKKGTRIVSAGFEFPNWKPVAIDPRGPIYGPLHLYIR